MRRFLFPCVPYYFPFQSPYFGLWTGIRRSGRCFFVLRCGFLSFHVTSPLIDGVDECSIISYPVRTTKSGLRILVPLFVWPAGHRGQERRDMYISQPITRPSCVNRCICNNTCSYMYTCIYSPIYRLHVCILLYRKTTLISNGRRICRSLFFFFKNKSRDRSIDQSINLDM